MAKNKKSKKSAVKKDGTTYFKGSQSKNFRLVDYDLKAFVDLGPVLSNWDELQNQVAAMLVLVFALAQIRSYYNGVPTSEIDALASVKWMKNTINKSADTRALVAIIAVASTLDFIEGSGDQDVEYAVIETFSNYKGNSRYIENVTKANVHQYRFGIMSRILGWLQSCSISNMSLLGIDPKTIGDLTLTDVLKKIGFGDPVKVTEILLGELPEDGTANLAFEESKLPSESRFNGCTQLETEIFGDRLTRTQAVGLTSSLGFGGIVQAGSINVKIIQENLSKVQLVQYTAALKNGNQEKLKALTEIAKQLHAERQLSNPPTEITPPIASTLKEAMETISVNKGSNKAVIFKAIDSLNSGITPQLLPSNTKKVLFAVYTRLKANPNLTILELLEAETELKLVEKP